MKRTALLTFSALLMSSTALFAQERMRSPGYTGDVSDTQASTPEATATCENWTRVSSS